MTDSPVVKPYGSWVSPLSARRIAEAGIGLSFVRADGESLYWLESRPRERGRSVLMRYRKGEVREALPAHFDVRSRVHEYGGGAYAAAGGRVVFSHFPEGTVWLVGEDGAPRQITPDAALRYADFAFGADGIYAVREDHRRPGEPVNSVVLLDPGRIGEGEPVCSGRDFYAYPRPDPDGRRLACIAWDHPDMPWDGTELLLDGEAVAGGPEESLLQPAWSADGRLHYISDRSGWWNLYVHDSGGGQALKPMAAEFAGPLWGLGAQSYRCLADGDIIARYEENGSVFVERLRAGPFETGFSRPACPVPFAGGWALPGADTDRPARLDLLHADGRRETLARSAPDDPDPAFVSRGEAVSFPTSGGRTAHAWFYPPKNPGFAAPDGERPPLVVRSHGGPTGASDNGYSSSIQYWTTRGFAVVDVNYGGSSGYGRAFRRQLDGQWGAVDVDDCCAAATWLAETGRADAGRLVVRGGSAGGYTTLAALAFRNVFKAGASLYGIGDLKALARDTHKFESRYLDRLIGPLPEAEAVYNARSPLLHADGISCPVIFLQGTEDKVVPPDQTEAMAAALQARGIPVALLLFDGEGHGFRQAENIVLALEAELSFFARILGFEAPGVPEIAFLEQGEDRRDI